jgi:hypothetical protein
MMGSGTLMAQELEGKKSRANVLKNLKIGAPDTPSPSAERHIQKANLE